MYIYLEIIIHDNLKEWYFDFLRIFSETKLSSFIYIFRELFAVIKNLTIFKFTTILSSLDIHNLKTVF